MHLVAQRDAVNGITDTFGAAVDWCARLLGNPGRAMMMRFEPDLLTWDVEPPSSYEALELPAEGLTMWVYPSGVSGSSISTRRERSYAVLCVSLPQGIDLGKPFSSLASDFWSASCAASRLALFAGEELEIDRSIIRQFLSGELDAESIDLCELVISERGRP